MDAFATLGAIIERRSGIVIGANKDYLLRSRLAPLLRREALDSLAELATLLSQSGNEALKDEVTDAVATHETFFFRDWKPFNHLITTGLPGLLRRRPPGTKLRIWSAAASTGQEAYSLAITLAECGLASRCRVEIVGTDIGRTPLEQARTGRFTQYEVDRGVSRLRLQRHFKPDRQGWVVNGDLRALCRFREWNLLDDLSPLGRFDVVFCRNVLFYFSRAVRVRVVAAIRELLAPDGLLYLGATESVLGIDDTLQRDGACYVSALAPVAACAVTPSHHAPPRAKDIQPVRA